MSNTRFIAFPASLNHPHDHYSTLTTHHTGNGNRWQIDSRPASPNIALSPGRQYNQVNKPKRETKMELQTIAQKVLTQPTPADLWELYGLLLRVGAPVDGPLVRIVEAAHHYLCDLQSKATARQYSELASMLDIGAVGGVALENLIGGGREHLLNRFLLGTFSESLMVMASRQYVRGWSAELRSVHCQAAWFLAGHWFSLSQQLQPELADDERWAHIDQLLAPARSDETPNEVKAVLLGRLFQLLLLAHLLPLLTSNLE